MGAILAPSVGKIDKRRTPREASPWAPRKARWAGERAGWRRHGWRLLALGGLVLVAYSNSFQAALVFDNASAIGEDPRIRAGHARKHRVHSDREGIGTATARARPPRDCIGRSPLSPTW